MPTSSHPAHPPRSHPARPPRSLPAARVALAGAVLGASLLIAGPATASTPIEGLAVHDVQGTGWLSPYAGDAVTGVTGVVTAVRTSSSAGFWMQDTAPDTDPATSEGIFVYTGSAPTVAPGDAVSVAGTVSEYYPLASGQTTSTTSNLSTTELTRATITVTSTGNPLPAPVRLTPGTVPNVYAPNLHGGNIEATPITPRRSALDFYESVEGMRVAVANARVVGPTDSYGEQYVTTKPTQDRTYRGGTELEAENATPSGRLEVVPLDGSDLAVDVGDVLTGNTVGPIDWSQYGGYVLQASKTGTVVHHDLPPAVAHPGGDGQLSVATYNVENLSPNDDPAKFATLAQGVVTDLASPDVVALEEIQDNDGSTDDGVTDASQTIDELTSAIAAAGGPSYESRGIDPVNDRDGGQPGGNIRQVLLYNPARVSPVDAGSASVNRSVTATKVVDRGGAPRLTLSPGRIDPRNPVWNASRKPLVAQFRFPASGAGTAGSAESKVVTVIANHFDAKLGDQNADGRFQYPAQSSQTQRAGQAAAVHDFVKGILAVDPQAPVVVLGDLNDYQFSSPLTVLRTGTAAGTGRPILTDLVSTLPVNQRYTYVYDGISEVLDHILVTSGVSGVDYQVVHVNAEYHDQVSDHDPQVVDLTP